MTEPPSLPVGEYWLRRGPMVGGAALCLLAALGLIVGGVVAAGPSGMAEWGAVLVAFTIGAMPIAAIGGLALSWLRGGPLLEVSEEGLRIKRAGLWMIRPFRKVPRSELLPWSDIVEIVPMPRADRAVVIRVRGRKEPWWERLLPLGMPRGIRLGLSFVGSDPVGLTRDLIRWSEHRLALEVRTGSERPLLEVDDPEVGRRIHPDRHLDASDPP